MLNVICVKWGDKYSANHVNRLYRMVEKNLTIPFEFHCYTDDDTNIIPWINIIPIEEEYERWWNKLYLFKKGLFTGPCLYLDLDVVIQKNIDSLLDHLTDKITLINCYWNDGENSSVMLWEDNSQLYDIFSADPEYWMLKYRGIDSMIYYEKIPINSFPQGLIYSRLHGFKDGDKPDHNLYYHPEASICIFNGYGNTIDHANGIHLDESSYKGFEHYWS